MNKQEQVQQMTTYMANFVSHIAKVLPDDIEPVGFILISDKIRTEAPQTLRYFAEQGVTLKVISGDNAVTVSNIAQKPACPTRKTTAMRQRCTPTRRLRGQLSNTVCLAA